MENKSYIIFEHNTLHYAVESKDVQEIVMLPELKAIEDVHAYIVGFINLRGKIAPIIDLAVRFGHTTKRYSIEDKVIFVDAQGQLAGIIANEVYDVIDIPETNIEATPSCAVSDKAKIHFVTGEVMVKEDVVMLLDINALIYASEQMKKFNVEEVECQTIPQRHFCPDASPRENEVFHKRAVNLASIIEHRDFTGLKALAAIILNGEYYGVDLKTVREFSEIGKIAPVPCTPGHILGNMNLRGDIMTLIDIRGFLNLAYENTNKLEKIVVVTFNEQLVGFAVDDVIEAMYVFPEDVASAPSGVEVANEEYFVGTVPYRNKMMVILDLNIILNKDEIIVDENV